MKTIELTRKELYDIVWSTPLSKLTQQYTLTNEGIKNICSQFEIPMPDGGYWMKLKFNKNVNKEYLNAIFDGIDKIVLTIREEGNTVNVDQTPLTIRTKEIENDLKAPLVVPDKLSKPDVLIQNTIEISNRRKNDNYYHNDKLDHISIYVQPENFPRALRIMDTFIKLLRYRGHSFRRDRNNRGPNIIVKEVEFPFHIRETQKRIPSEKKYETSTYISTGLLAIKIGESYKAIEWKDGKTKLENQLAKIVAKIELLADDELIQQEKIRLWHSQYEEERKRQQEIKIRKDDEVAKFNKLVSLSEQYNKSLLIRQYIEAERQKAIRDNNLTLEKQEWLQWATDKADWLDPLVSKFDEILDAK